MRQFVLHRIALCGVSAMLLACLPVSPPSATADPLIVAGTSQVTYTLPVTGRPSVALLDHARMISRWASDGQGSLRVDEQTVEPSLESGTRTFSVSNSELTEYSDLYGKAIRYPLSASITRDGTWGFLGSLAGGSAVGIVQQMGSGFVTWAHQQGLHAAVTGQETILGRQTSVIEVSPLYKSGGSGAAPPVGKETIWLDTQYPIVLKETMSGGPSDNPKHWLYQVTSLTFGSLPDPGFLQYQPPVTPTAPPPPQRQSNPGSGLPSPTLSGPKPFITVKAPPGYSLQNLGSASDPLWGKTSSIQGLLKGNGYIAVEEQVRVHGLPSGLKTGSSHKAGSCRAWTGTSSGARWLALRRTNVSLLAVSDTLSQKSLLHFAATGICP